MILAGVCILKPESTRGYVFVCNMLVGLGKEIDHTPTARIKSGYVYRREMNFDSPEKHLRAFLSLCLGDKTRCSAISHK